MKELGDKLHTGHVTVTGQTVAENVASAQNYNPAVIKTLAAPFKEKAGIAVLRGNLARAAR